MRKITTITILLGIMFCEFAAIGQEDVGKIVITNAKNNYPKFLVSLNGIRLTNEYTQATSFNFLDGTRYEAKFLQAGSTTVKTYTLSSEPKYISKYVIMQDNFGNYSVVLASKSLLAMEPVEPAEKPSAVIAQTVSVKNNSVPTNANPVAVKPVPTGVNPPPTNVAPTVVEVTAIDEKDFAPRLNSVKKESFDKNRLGKAKQIFDDEVLNTGQVSRLVKLFSFDDSRLDFAKWAYNRTIDKNNYYKVEDLLSFGTSKAALRDYIKKQPK